MEGGDFRVWRRGEQYREEVDSRAHPRKEQNSKTEYRQEFRTATTKIGSNMKQHSTFLWIAEKNIKKLIIVRRKKKLNIS